MMRVMLCYPKCTTCQKALKWLDDRGIGYVYRNIKEERPTEEELRQWIQRSGLPVQRFFNTSGLLYRSMNLKEKTASMTDDEKIALLATDGMLVKRPLLIDEKGVLVGFREADYERMLQRGEEDV
ncbi:MAG: arsenate reductase family protein [Clostridia bacterium]|nr:arsenate reductase family protein [Clostridia bacterium]MBR3196082.1 arsenate reductase family protein [Clostridia bacterium]